MEKYLKFDEPKQVKFIDFDRGSDETTWLGGIAYGEEIICGCCGGTISLKDYYEDWDNFGKDEHPEVEEPLVVYGYWVDIERDIRD
jgi:hypothetical protein